MKIKKGDKIKITFRNQTFPLRSGIAEVTKIISRKTFMISVRGHSVILDIADHGKSFRVEVV